MTGFTDKQVEVVRLIAQGLSYREMGEHLGVHMRTAKAHTNAVRVKLSRLGHHTDHAREVPAAFWRSTGVNPYPTKQKELVR